MSERDELGGILMEEANANGLYMGIITTDNMADAILAAGYRKPRQVTTVEELDALPFGSVVLDADRATATRLDADYWEVAGYASHFRIDAITLPATVLHVGGAE